ASHFIILPSPASLTRSITNACSSSLKLLELGKQRPFRFKYSATSPPTRSYPSYNFCVCIGFHTGRASILAASKYRRSSLAEIPNSFSSTKKQLNQFV